LKDVKDVTAVEIYRRDARVAGEARQAVGYIMYGGYDDVLTLYILYDSSMN
jgi:hypothetical protein